ncbi:PREDICTED: iridoid synthase isoform X2 [Tarenaya hassleriana]|uniref:iridoid synthase isoform X2 n=1 Tax=Tarenaya hassleriana TaxID=28532 RepID=UPI00053C604D|nr:PREDICTED: iridoid synthase isoform X2 [Tarenaya hassleriana]
MAPENCSFSRTKEEEEEEEENVAVIFGVTGLVGREIAKRLSSKPRWKIFGIARNPEIKPTNNGKIYTFISCDLLNPSETRQKLSPLQEIVTHAFWVTWSGEFPLDTDECCEQNSRMMANALGAILPNARRLKHFSLQTGMKHYVSLRDPLFQTLCYYSEECPRARSGRNFYYALEDLLHEKLSGTRECWEESYIDGSDSRLVAEQHIYAATSGKVSEKGEAFNAVNGFRFSWKELWPQIGKKLGVQVTETEMFNEGFWYEREMAEKNRVWDEIVEKERLARTEVGDLANWRFMDMLFRCPFKLLGTRDKADRLGFKRRFRTLDSILHWIDVMRDEKLIPHTRDRPPFV